MSIAKTQKTSKNTVSSVNARCDELENIVTRLEARINELENNLGKANSDTDSSWKNKIEEIIKVLPDGEWACRQKGL